MNDIDARAVQVMMMDDVHLARLHRAEEDRGYSLTYQEISAFLRLPDAKVHFRVGRGHSPSPAALRAWAWRVHDAVTTLLRTRHMEPPIPGDLPRLHAVDLVVRAAAPDFFARPAPRAAAHIPPDEFPR